MAARNAARHSVLCLFRKLLTRNICWERCRLHGTDCIFHLLRRKILIHVCSTTAITKTEIIIHIHLLPSLQQATRSRQRQVKRVPIVWTAEASDQCCFASMKILDLPPTSFVVTTSSFEMWHIPGTCSFRQRSGRPSSRGPRLTERGAQFLPKLTHFNRITFIWPACTIVWINMVYPSFAPPGVLNDTITTTHFVHLPTWM